MSPDVLEYGVREWAERGKVKTMHSDEQMFSLIHN